MCEGLPTPSLMPSPFPAVLKTSQKLGWRRIMRSAYHFHSAHNNWTVKDQIVAWNSLGKVVGGNNPEKVWSFTKHWHILTTSVKLFLFDCCISDSFELPWVSSWDALIMLSKIPPERDCNHLKLVVFAGASLCWEVKTSKQWQIRSWKNHGPFTAFSSLFHPQPHLHVSLQFAT